ncbi:MAG: hypothetical protein BGO63_15755 [Candidatus Accumulibacter sp. 66-26]|nr:MAG: hypothetical protein BGO63_15755 [Candidatus Accumulibacter sp. 66-26]
MSFGIALLTTGQIFLSLALLAVSFYCSMKATLCGRLMSFFSKTLAMKCKPTKVHYKHLYLVKVHSLIFWWPTARANLETAR